jgi:hypothetical protein
MEMLYGVYLRVLGTALYICGGCRRQVGGGGVSDHIRQCRTKQPCE